MMKFFKCAEKFSAIFSTFALEINNNFLKKFQVNMEQSQFFELLSEVDPLDHDDCLEFTNLNLFNNGRMKAFVKPLIGYCLTKISQENTPQIDKTDVFNAMFPGQKYVDGKLEKVMVEAQRVVKSFLITKFYFREENQFNRMLDFSEITKNENLRNRYNLTISKLNQYQDNVTCKNETFLKNQLTLEYAIHCQECLKNFAKGNLNIPNNLYALDLYYDLNRLGLLNRFLLQLKVANLEIPEIVNFHISDKELLKRHIDDNIYIKISYKIFDLLQKKSITIVEAKELFALLQSSEKFIDIHSLGNFYTHLRNFVSMILMEDRDRVEILLLLHDLYKDNLSKGYLHDSKKLLPIRYLAVAENALKINEIEWALNFIETYKDQLHNENETKDIYRFVKSRYLFSIGQFEKCLDLLPETSPFLDFMLLGKRLEIKAMYELKSDLLTYKLDAFKMFLSRTSTKLLSETQRRTHVDFTNLFTQILTSIPGDVKRAEKVLGRIKENKQVAERIWLTEKAQELKKGK